MQKEAVNRKVYEATVVRKPEKIYFFQGGHIRVAKRCMIYHDLVILCSENILIYMQQKGKDLSPLKSTYKPCRD